MKQQCCSLESLWRSTAERLRRFLYRTLGDGDAANDLVSQTFLEAARGWKRYRGKGSRQAWLFGIARNLVKKELNRRGRQRSVPLEEAAWVPAAEPPDQQAILESVWAAIQQLPPHLQQTLTLRLADELSYEEIAAALDVPLGTVRSRLHDAVRRLKAQLRSLGELENGRE